MYFEHFSQPILPHAAWFRRVLRSLWMVVIIVLTTLTIGILGYHYIGQLEWIDSILEASMILGGMGAIAPMQNDAVKLFASAYALFSGFMILSTAGILIAPFLHRMLHHSYHQHKNDQNK